MKNSAADQPFEDPQEPFSKMPKRVLAAPAQVLTPAAKIVYLVINGMPAARVGKPVHLTQQQIAAAGGISVRTVSTATQTLVALKLIAVDALPSASGFNVYAYRVLKPAESLLPPAAMPSKSSSPRLREVLAARITQAADLAAATGGDCMTLAAEFAGNATAASASVARNISRQEEALQEQVQEVHEEQPEKNVPTPPFEVLQVGDAFGVEFSDEVFDDATFAALGASISEAAELLLGFLENDSTRANSFIQEGWDPTVPLRANVNGLLALARLQTSL